MPCEEKFYSVFIIMSNIYLFIYIFWSGEGCGYAGIQAYTFTQGVFLK